jgi:hypothetical protein
VLDIKICMYINAFVGRKEEAKEEGKKEGRNLT